VAVVQSPATWAGFAVLAVGGLMILLVRRDPATDDGAFVELTGRFGSMQDWVAFRYESWSGRLLPEALIYALSSASIRWWRVISLVSLTATLLLLLAYLRLLVPSLVYRRRLPLLVLVAGGLLFVMNDAVLRAGALWVTGAMNYAWMVPLVLAGLYPLAHLAARHRWPAAWALIGAALCVPLAASSQEQLGAVMVGAAVLSAAFLLWREHRSRVLTRASTLGIALFALLPAAGFAVLMAAPGNARRMATDTAVWLPDFWTTPVAERLNFATRFVVDQLVNQSGLALALIWAAAAMVVVLRGIRDRWDRAALVVALVGLMTLPLRGLTSSQVVFALHGGWKERIDGSLPTVVLGFWILLLVATALLPLLVFRSGFGATLSVGVVAAMLSIVVMTQSASMYASGPRVMFVPTVMLLAVGLALLTHCLLLKERAFCWAAVAVTVVAGVQCVNLTNLLLTTTGAQG